MAIVSAFSRVASFHGSREQADLRLAQKADLAASIKAATAAPASTSTDLNDLLAESLTESRNKLQVRAARDAIAQGTVKGEDAAALNATVRAWEAKREWHTRADVAMFSRLQCRCCDNLYTQFRGFFHRQVHRSSDVERWVPSERPLPTSGLPKEVKYQDGFMELCEDCAQEAGYDVASHYDYEGEGEE